MASRLNPGRFKRAEELFAEALERPSEERGDFLHQSCGSDLGLRRQVERLLTADDEASRFLARPALERIERPSRRQMVSEPELIGPYQLIRLIGEGGMSKVWLAIRADHEVRRRVAVKCLRHSMATQDLRRRLRRERQILASLDHPYIAQLFDVGTTENGLPYFVMEYIEGEPITDYCDQRRLTIDERLELFRGVCSAVHYAHQNLVVHRDIKPTNILVGEDGLPKLLDFGVAKWLNPELTSQHLAPTTPWQQFLTPGYASPEQIRGQRVTTASDVYSLGVLLFELLIGRRPYQLTGQTPQEIERVLAEEESESLVKALADDSAESRPISHARRAEPQQLRRRLAGDLDNIVAKALRKEPNRRYTSAQQFAEDVRRHGVGLPVIARKPTLGYRAARFVRRNRVALGVAAAFTTLLIAAAIGLGLLSVRLANERDLAHREREHVSEVADFLQEVLELTGPDTSKKNPVTREILDLGSQRLAELEEQPELQSSLMRTVGSVYSELGFQVEAQQHLESALEIQQGLFEAPHLSLAQTLSTLAKIDHRSGDLVSAEARLRQVLEMRRALLGAEHPDVATAMGQLGTVLEERGHYEPAEDLCREALAVHRRSLGANDPELGDSVNRLGRVLFRRAKYAEAESLLRESLERRRSVLGADHLDVADSMNSLALVFKATGAYDDSERMLHQALEINRQRFGDYHLEVAGNLNNLASLATYRKEYVKAEALYREALEVMRVIVGEDHPNLAFLMLGIGTTKTRLGDHQGAEPLLREALEIRSKIYPAGNHLVANAQILLGSCLMELGRFDEAETLLISAYEVLDAQEPKRWREWKKTVRYLVGLYGEWGKSDLAAEYQEILDSLPPEAAGK